MIKNKITRDPQINIRVPEEMKEKLHNMAAANRRSVNAEAVAAIEKAIAAFEAGYIHLNHYTAKPIGDDKISHAIPEGFIDNIHDAVEIAVRYVLSRQEKEKCDNDKGKEE